MLLAYSPTSTWDWLACWLRLDRAVEQPLHSGRGTKRRRRGGHNRSSNLVPILGEEEPMEVKMTSPPPSEANLLEDVEMTDSSPVKDPPKPSIKLAPIFSKNFAPSPTPTTTRKTYKRRPTVNFNGLGMRTLTTYWKPLHSALVRSQDPPGDAGQHLPVIR